MSRETLPTTGNVYLFFSFDLIMQKLQYIQAYIPL